MSTTKPTTGEDGPVVTVTLTADVLPGVVRDLLMQVGMKADTLEHELRGPGYDPDRGTLAAAAMSAASLRVELGLLDQIGWQTRRSVTITAPTATLRRIFGAIHVDASNCVAEITADPDPWAEPERALTSYQRARDGSGDVLAQLEPVGTA